MPTEDKKQRLPPESAGVYFGAVVQADFSSQMDVFRWLLSDNAYLVCYILHDKDTYTPEEIAEHSGGSEVYTRTNGDGTQSEFRAGDVKPAHYHLIFKVQKRMRASSLAKRFSGQLHFELLSDAASNARYLTHSTFDSRQKHQYKLECVKFSEVTQNQSQIMFNTLYAGFGGGLVDTVERICTRRAEIAASGAAEPRKELVRALCSSGDVEGLSSLMSHAYFFKEFT